MVLDAFQKDNKFWDGEECPHCGSRVVYLCPVHGWSCRACGKTEKGNVGESE